MKNKIIFSIVLVVAIFAVSLNFGGDKSIDVVAREAVASFKNVFPNFTGEYVSPSGLEKFFLGEKVGVEFAIKPFLDAGLDPSKLPKAFSVSGDSLVISIDNKAYGPSSTFSEFVGGNRESIGYHLSLGHFGIALKVSHFEWAKDAAKNDKDIIFMLNPAILGPAGLDPKKLEGWVLATVQLMDGNLKYDGERLLKIYNVK